MNLSDAGFDRIKGYEAYKRELPDGFAPPTRRTSLGRLQAEYKNLRRTSDDHETRLRKVETRLQRGAILAALMTSGVGGNMNAEQIRSHRSAVERRVISYLCRAAWCAIAVAVVRVCWIIIDKSI